MTPSNVTLSPPGIIVLNRDLMLGIAIGNSARALGYTVERVPSTAALVDRMQHGLSGIALTIIDMNLDIDWTGISDLMQSGYDLPPVLGFGPHVDIEGRKAAKRAGLTRIVSNGEFHRDMAGLIQRYARIAPARAPTANLD